MSLASVQIKRISEKVAYYFQKYGYRTHTTISNQSAKIGATPELGVDLFECRIVETARGTAVGFYATNQWVNFLPAIPFVLVILLYLLNLIPGLNELISGFSSLGGINYIKLFLGDFEISIFSVIIITAIPTVFVVTNFFFQKVRLQNIKLRFNYFTRDAKWDPENLTSSMAAFRGAQVGFFQGWFIAVIYFTVLALSNATIAEITGIYGGELEAIKQALFEGFSALAGATIGLIAGDKAQQIRKEISIASSGLRYKGGLQERRFEPILFSLQAGGYSGIIGILFFSVTFLSGASFTIIAYLLLGYLVASVISGYIRDEGPLWFSASVGIILIGTSLSFIFRTGSEAPFAFIVILHLLLIPYCFVIIANHYFTNVLKKSGISTSEHLYHLFPFSIFLSLVLVRRRKSKIRKRYEKEIEDENYSFEDTGLLFIDKTMLENKGKNALILAKHYFELIGWYNTLFEENDVILLPKIQELTNYWIKKSKKEIKPEEVAFVEFADKFIWDESFSPEETNIDQNEAIGREMVFSIQ